MENPKLLYKPCLDRAIIEHDLQELLAPGVLTDRDLERRIAGLGERFRIYVANYPLGLWAPGLVVTSEMRNLTEIYLPIGEVRRVFDRFFSVSLRFDPFRCASLVHGAAGWIDILLGLRELADSPDPSALLSRLLADEELRRVFLFANFMPPRYGCRFGRYPEQMILLQKWLKKNRERLESDVRCLDTACGSGEGTYELARLLCECGFSPGSMQITGATLEHFELFAAAHCYFPHDLRREEACRRQVERLFQCGAAENIRFTLANLMDRDFVRGEEFDIVLCNGLLGGPFLHHRQQLQETVQRLADRLRPGGILAAANRFHGGWDKLAGEEMLRMIFAECRLRILPAGEGVAGERY